MTDQMHEHVERGQATPRPAATTTKHQRVGPGAYQCELDGKPVIRHDTLRDMNCQLDTTLNALSGSLGQPVPPDLMRARLEDTKAAIQSLAYGGLEGIQERLAAQAIAAEAVGHQLLQQSAVVSQSAPTETAQRLAQAQQHGAIKFFDVSRKALVALAETKRPSRQTTFVKHQQNLLLADGDTAGSAANKPKQLEESHALEYRVTPGGRSAMPRTATVGAQHRAEDRRR